MVAYFTSNATKKELLLLMLFSSLSTTTAVVCNRKTTRKEVDKKLKNFVPRVGMCLAVLIIKFQHKIGTHKIHFYPQAKTWRNVSGRPKPNKTEGSAELFGRIIRPNVHSVFAKYLAE